MSAPACPRSWQAEAAEDLRLSEADRSSFERHVVTCGDCQRAVRELELMRGLATLRDHEPSELEHRRGRNHLLRRANALTLGERAPRRSRAWVVALGFALVAMALLVLLRPRSGADVALPRGGSAPSYEMVTSAGAEWSTLERGATQRLALRRGRFELSVRHLAPGQRFLLALPDGELEVRGTRFVVEVDGARTLAVDVQEGRVALRVRERASGLLLLGAGERFAATKTPVASASASAEAPPAPAAVPLPSPPPAPVSSGSARPQAAPSVDAPSETRPDGASGADFASAMSAFSAGNYGEAERRFLAFVARHPSDPRAEDATFLSAVSSARRGDDAGARAHARRYLQRYPNGLRRLEATRLAE